MGGMGIGRSGGTGGLVAVSPRRWFTSLAMFLNLSSLSANLSLSSSTRLGESSDTVRVERSSDIFKL